jgi:hypothetical protein
MPLGDAVRATSTSGVLRTLRADRLPGDVVIVKGRTKPFPAWQYRGGRWKEKEVSTMEGILFDIEMFASPVTVLLGLVLLAIGVGGILLGYMADEEASGKEIFRAESPFTEVGEAPVESVKYLRAA